MKLVKCVLSTVVIMSTLMLSLAAVDINSIPKEQLLEKIDQSFMPEEARFSIRLDHYENNELKKYFVSDNYAKGADKYLLLTKEPPVVAGQTQLRIGDTIHVYVKKIDRIKKVSAKVEFFGSLFSQEDIMSTKLSTYYNVEEAAAAELEGKPVYSVTLVGKNKQVAYHKIVLYVDRETLQPVQREYYAYSGKMIKKMVIGKIDLKDNKLESVELTMYDTLREGRYTQVVLNNFVYEEVPDKYFSTTYMKAISR